MRAATPGAAVARIELSKLKRTRVVPFGAALSAGVVLFACMGLFSADGVDGFVREPGESWAAYVVGYVMAVAFLTPVQLALLASRVIDIENAGSGWRLNATANVPAGTLVFSKWLVTAALVVALKLVECCAVVAVPLVLGAPAPEAGVLRAGVALAFGTVGTSVALLALLMWLAARVESQLVVLGVGVIGGFLAVAALLSPTSLAAVNPFGYFAMLTPFTFTESGVEATPPHWGAWAVYLCVACGLFAALTRALNERED